MVYLLIIIAIIGAIYVGSELDVCVGVVLILHIVVQPIVPSELRSGFICNFII